MNQLQRLNYQLGAHSDCPGSAGCKEPDRSRSLSNDERTARIAGLKSVTVPVPYTANNKRQFQSVPKRLRDDAAVSYRHGLMEDVQQTSTSPRLSLHKGQSSRDACVRSDVEEDSIVNVIQKLGILQSLAHRMEWLERELYNAHGQIAELEQEREVLEFTSPSPRLIQSYVYNVSSATTSGRS